MRLPDDVDMKERLAPPIVSALGAVCAVIIIIVIMVLVMNREKLTQNDTANISQNSTPSQMDASDIGEVGKSDLLPEDFDFWEMYPEATSTPVPEVVEEEPEEEDPSKDGRHTKIINDSGKEEWVLISPYLDKNTYDFSNLVSHSGLMRYYKDGEEVSFVGVDISKYQDHVDFNKLKKAGIDFCMIRVGARGYGTGQLILDENFQDNIKRATDAGLEVGVYFFSQAITEEEVMEEANMVLEYITDYEVSYPIAFDMEYIENDTARVEQLSKKEKTEIAKTFMDTVKAAGYTPILYGKKEWLIKKLDLSDLEEYDVWLSQYEDIPDYPYKFSMWQYTNQGTVDGISGKVDLNISFIDYSEK